MESKEIIRGLIVALVLSVLLLGSCINALRHSWLNSTVTGHAADIADIDVFVEDIEYKMRDRFTGTDAEAMREEIKAWVRQTIDQALKDRNGKAEAPEQANSGDSAKRGAAAT